MRAPSGSAHTIDPLSCLKFDTGKNATVLHKVKICTIAERRRHFGDPLGFQCSQFFGSNDPCAVDRDGQEPVRVISRSEFLETFDLYCPFVCCDLLILVSICPFESHPCLRS